MAPPAALDLKVTLILLQSPSTYSEVGYIQMVNTSAWLTSRSIDQLTVTHFEEYKTVYDEFVDAVAYEETRRSAGPNGNTSYGRVLREARTTGGVWYSHALTSLNAFPVLFDDHILLRFTGELHTEAKTALMMLRSENATNFVADKVAQQEQYSAQLEELFANGGKEEDASGTEA